MLRPQAQCLLIDPLFGLNALLILVVCGRYSVALECLQAAVVGGSDKVNDAVARPFALLAGRWNDAVTAGA